MVLWILVAAVVGVAVSQDDYAGKMCAFADINFDRYTDVIVVDPKGNKFTVYAASTEHDSLSELSSKELDDVSSRKIVNCAVGDFDGDSFPDLLLSLADNEEDDLIQQVCLCFGNQKEFLCQFCPEFKEKAGQPSVLDCNNDYLSDFFIPFANGSGFCFSFKNRTDFYGKRIFGSENNIIPEFVHTYIDLNEDYNAEVVIGRVKEKNRLELSVWSVSEGEKDLLPPLSKVGSGEKLFNSLEIAAYGQPVVGDFDADGKAEVIIPACEQLDDNLCSKVKLLIAKSGSEYWSQQELNLTDPKGVSWKMFNVRKSTLGEISLIQSRIRVGDQRLTGYPGLLLVLESSGGKQAFMIKNVVCGTSEACAAWPRSFKIDWNLQLISVLPNGGVLNRVAFFDLSEDGILDVVLQYQDTKGDERFRFLKSDDPGDTSFIKAEVLTATCLSCKNGHEGSGISAPGAVLCYQSLDEIGDDIFGTHTQLSQTSYNSLQLPYALFGIGRTPNFVEKLTVGIPANVSVKRSWEQIVPNSRLYIIPYPPDQPKHWKNKLYLTPSRLILLSFAALCCVCGVILFFIVILHWRERRQDKVEKQQQAHKFNFDAM